MVIKTTVYLSDEEAEGLRRVAASTGKSQSALIRAGVRQVIAQPYKRTFHRMGIAEGPPYAQVRWTGNEIQRRAIRGR
jgi:predicted transcriptional regulator